MGAMTEAALFDVDAPPPPAAETLSRGRQRTIRQAEALTGGRHPLELALSRPLTLHPEAAPADDRTAPGRRCGNCRFRQMMRGYPKCTFGKTDSGYPRLTHSAATDTRAWWPGCVDHETREATR